MYLGQRLLAVALASLVAGVAIENSDHGPKHESSKSPKLVKGKVFDRFVTIWLENTNFDSAMQDPNFQALANQGLILNNYFGVTHPSEPNYISAVGGDYFGMDNDNLNAVPENVSTVVDLLEEKGISWASYQEDLPFSGFPGFSAPNAATGADDYVRKHNPLIIYDSVATVPARANLIKNYTLFEQDLANNRLPQWIFMTPNMTNDGHDTNITFAGRYIRNFVEPLLKNKNFNSENAKTLLFVTFDEDGGDPHNRVRSILMGSALPHNLIGKQDDTYYDHYSEISTVEANWDLHTLGRYDVGANVFKFMAEKTKDVIRIPRNPTIDQTFLNASYPGIFNSRILAPIPVPNTDLVVNGRKVLPQVVKTWGHGDLQRCTVYHGQLELPSAFNPPVLPNGC